MGKHVITLLVATTQEIFVVSAGRRGGTPSIGWPQTSQPVKPDYRGPEAQSQEGRPTPLCQEVPSARTKSMGNTGSTCGVQ
jgi:hypothetical protein